MLFAIFAVAVQAEPFFDCQAELQPLLSDQAALDKVKQVHVEGKQRFSSECLEILMKKNFLGASNYLIDSYYPSTRIDTDIIVKKVEADITRQQNKLLFTLLENANKDKFWPPVHEPVLFYAQSRDAVWVKLKFAGEIDSAGCGQVLNRSVDIGPQWIKVSVVCFESEDNVRKYEKKITFAQDVDFDEMRMKEEEDGVLELKVPKKSGPSYWPELLRNLNPKTDVVWKYINDYYFEEVQDLKEKQAKEQAKISRPDKPAEVS